MYYQFRNLPISINGATIITESVSLNQSATIADVETISDRFPLSRNANNGVNGELKISYYLTGADPIAAYINNESLVASGNIGGLYFNSGYLSSYSLAANQVGPVVVNSVFNFYTDLAGTLTRSNPITVSNYSFLNYLDSNVSIDSSFSQESISTISSINYNYSAEIVPVFTAKTGSLNSTPQIDYVRYGKKEITAQVECDDYISSLTETGKNISITTNFYNPINGALVSSFGCSGFIHAKTLSIKNNDLARTTLEIKQIKIDSDPVITGFTTLSSPGSYIHISGKNLLNTSAVYFGDRFVDNYTVISDSLVSGIVPYDALTGRIKIETFGGNTSTTSNYNLTYPSIAINYLSKQTGVAGDSILISGNNFYRVSAVKFGGVTGSYQVINSGIIEAILPSLAPTGYIEVASTGRAKFVISTLPFYSNPSITGISSYTGKYGESVIISGYNFSGIQNVYFNSIQASSYTINSIGKITVTVPTGNIKGYIRLAGPVGNDGFSNFSFAPYIKLTGITTGAMAGEGIRISGDNFQPSIIYSGQEGVKVRIGAQTATGFLWIDEQTISGILPAGTTDGQVGLFEADGASIYPVYQNFKAKYSQFIVSSVSPSVAYSGWRYDGYLQGVNMYNITGIIFSGYQSCNTGRVFYVNNSDLRSDYLGKRVNIVNYTGFVLPTGTADSYYAPTGRFRIMIRSDIYNYTMPTNVGYLTIYSVSGLLPP